MKLNNLSDIKLITEKVEDASSFRVLTTEYYVPLGDKIDKEAELKKLNDELRYAKEFLCSVLKKLNNERFAQNAPEKVVEMERKKHADTVTKIEVLEERIQGLK